MFRRVSAYGLAAGGAFALLAAAVLVHSAELKTLGRLKIPPDARVLSVCTDPVVQEVLSDDLRQHRGLGPEVVVTVTVSARELAPGVSLQDLSPGDPSIAEMLKSLGAEPPLLGDTGDKPLEDPYTAAARQEFLYHADPNTQGFRDYLARRDDMRTGHSPYDKIPNSEIYQTAIVARASISDSSSELKVVALVDPGDDLRMAKKQVAEEIANAILH